MQSPGEFLGVSLMREKFPDTNLALVTKHTLAEYETMTHGCVLVVDDNSVNLKVAVRFLQKMGLRADVASNGLEAVHAFEQTSMILS